MKEQSKNHIEYEEEREVSLLDVFKVCFKYKHVITAVMLACVILGTLFIQLIYNKNNTVYASNFAIYHSALPVVSDADKDFYFYSEDLLDELKDNEDLSGIDFEGIKEDGFILEFDNVDKRYASFVYERPSIYYYFAIDSQFVPNKEKAKALIDQLANAALKSIGDKLKNVGYDSYLQQASGAISYTQEINALEGQKNFLIENYKALGEVYGMGYVINGKTITEIIADINSYDDSNSLNVIANTVRANGYVKKTNAKGENVDATYFAMIEQEIYSLGIKLVENNEAIAQINANMANLGISGEAATPFVEQLSKLISDNNDYTSKIAFYEKCINNPKYDDVEDKNIDESLTKYSAKMVEYTNAYKENIVYIFETTSKVIYEDKEKVELDGGLGLGLTIIATVILGLVVSCFVVLIVNSIAKVQESEKKHKEQNKTE